MKYFCMTFLISFALLSGCIKKDGPCRCVPPPFTESSWKITGIQGGIAGKDVDLTEDQKNTILRLKESGTFSATNTATGVTVSGTYAIQNFQSIYGGYPKITFTPKLPVFNNDYFVLLENPSGKQVWGDNLADGYRITITAIP